MLLCTLWLTAAIRRGFELYECLLVFCHLTNKRVRKSCMSLDTRFLLTPSSECRTYSYGFQALLCECLQHEAKFHTTSRHVALWIRIRVINVLASWQQGPLTPALWNKSPLYLTPTSPSIFLSLPPLPLPFPFSFSFPVPQIQLWTPQRGLGQSPSRKWIWWILSENLASGENKFNDVHEEIYRLPPVSGKTFLP